MEAPTSEFKNGSTWADVAVASTLTPFAGVYQLADDRSIYEGQVFASKKDVVHAIKTWSIKTHQQYYVYKSSKTLLKLRCEETPDYVAVLDEIRIIVTHWRVFRNACHQAVSALVPHLNPCGVPKCPICRGCPPTSVYPV